MARNTNRGGRYTPPKAAVGVDSDAEFWASMRRQTSELRQRCNALLGDHPPTDEEWVDADLAGMDGFAASDEELVAYWATHRRSVELGYDEMPDLAFIAGCSRQSKDPVIEYTTGWDDE